MTSFHERCNGVAPELGAKLAITDHGFTRSERLEFMRLRSRRLGPNERLLLKMTIYCKPLI